MNAQIETYTPRMPDRIRKIVDDWPPLDEARKTRIAALLRNNNN